MSEAFETGGKEFCGVALEGERMEVFRWGWEERSCGLRLTYVVVLAPKLKKNWRKYMLLGLLKKKGGGHTWRRAKLTTNAAVLKVLNLPARIPTYECNQLMNFIVLISKGIWLTEQSCHQETLNLNPLPSEFFDSQNSSVVACSHVQCSLFARGGTKVTYQGQNRER